MSRISRFPLKMNQLSAVAVVVMTIGISGCGGGSEAVAPPPLPPLIGAEATTGSKVLSWFERVAESLYEVARGVAAVAEGNVVAGVGEFAAAGLGIVSKGLESGESGDDQAKQLTEIDSKLDTVIVDVQSIANQVSTMELQLKNLADYLKSAAAMKTPMDTAQTWLDSYYTGTTLLQSREWVRWYLAGCDPIKVGSCPSASNAPSAANLALFRQAYMQNSDNRPLVNNRDNFPLWWAFAVVGDQTTGGTKFSVNGTKASDIVTQIYQGLTNNMGQDTNGLISYMNYFMTQDSSHCGKDVTDPQCDLYNNVYLPLETYFSLAIGRQSQLVMALAEAYTVLAQEDPNAYGPAGNNLMAGFNKQLAVEVEAFLRAAEQLALYRAADGRTDWSNFADTDAGRLLARADFVVAQIAGKNYRTASTTPKWTPGDVNPPWPASGIVGRVFYANGEQMLSGTATRSVCHSTDATCSSALTQVGENADSLRSVNGAQPYLLWKSTVDAKGAVTLMTGTANTQWSVQRLTPMAASTLPVGASYLVNSTQSPTRTPAKLGFYNYDENFDTPPGEGSSSVIPFGSFSAVEGAIGRYGLKLDAASFKGSADMSATLFDDSYGISTANPGAVSYSVTYVPNKHYNSKWDGLGTTAGTWSGATAVKLMIPLATATQVKMRWPSTLDVHLNSAFQYTTGLGGNGAGRDEYYSYVKFKQHIQDSKGNELNLASGKSSVVNSDCTSAPFFKCQIGQEQSIDMTVSTATATANNLSFSAKFSTEVDQYDKRWVFFNWYETVRTSDSNSVATWDIQAPLFTLIR